MKRFLIILLALLVCIPSVYARKKSKKSGVIEDNIYTDAEYDFTIKILENWEAKLQKPKKMIRLAHFRRRLQSKFFIVVQLLDLGNLVCRIRDPVIT